jgi:hypothetical protein
MVIYFVVLHSGIMHLFVHLFLNIPPPPPHQMFHSMKIKRLLYKQLEVFL